MHERLEQLQIEVWALQGLLALPPPSNGDTSLWHKAVLRCLELIAEEVHMLQGMSPTAQAEQMAIIRAMERLLLIGVEHTFVARETMHALVAEATFHLDRALVTATIRNDT